jgi:nitrogen fixation NifU-like protein
MSDLRDLYQEVILDHNRHPRNFRVLEPASHQAKGHNPLCGDRVEVYLRIEDGVVREVSFEGDGCAISTASASIMTEAVLGKRLEEVETLFREFHQLVTQNRVPEVELGKLAVLAGVRDYPSRVKCATLPWHTLQAALNHQAKVSTES